MREQDLIMNLSQNSEPLLEAKDIGFAYDKREIITGVNLKLYKNELYHCLE